MSYNYAGSDTIKEILKKRSTGWHSKVMWPCNGARVKPVQ